MVPTLLEMLGFTLPESIAGVNQMPLEGTSFAASLTDAASPAKSKPQYFDMFGHRGLVKDGWKAVAYHPPGQPFEDDIWELYHLEKDFSESRDLAAEHLEKLETLKAEWWRLAEVGKVLPLDDRFGPQFAENAQRFHGARTRFMFHKGMGHVPTDVAPDVRSCSYRIEADVRIEASDEGVLIAHGDMTSGYSLFLRNGWLVHDLNIGEAHAVVVSDRPVEPGHHRLGVAVRPAADGRRIVLLIDGVPAGETTTPLGFHTLISWSGLDIGLDRGSPVSDYAAPFAFTGLLRKVTVAMNDDQALDGEAEMARQ